MAKVREEISIRAMFNVEDFETSSQTLQRKMQMTAKKLKSIGTTMMFGLTVPIAGAVAYAVKEFAEFDQSMKKLQAITPGASADSMERLGDLAKRLGISTRFTADQVANLMYNYSKLGFNTSEIEAVTEHTLMLANAMEEELPRAAEIAGATLRGFGLEATEMERVLNVMAKAFTGSALDMEKWMVSVPKLAPIAKQLGVSIEEVAAMYGALADTGIEASIIGTSMRKIFLDLANSGMSYEEAMKRIVYSGASVTKAFEDQKDAMISNADGMAKATTARELFAIRAVPTALNLAEFSQKIKDNTKAFGEWEASTEDGMTALQRMSSIIDGSLKMSFIRFKSAVSGLGIEFGEVLAPLVSSIAGKLAKLAIKMAGLNDTTKKMILAVLGVVAVTPLVLIAIGSISSAIMGMAGAVGVATAPFLLWVIGIMAVSAAMLAFSIWLNDNRAAIVIYFVNLAIEARNALLDIAIAFYKTIARMKSYLGFSTEGLDQKISNLYQKKWTVKLEQPKLIPLDFSVDKEKMKKKAKEISDIMDGFMGVDKDKGDTLTDAQRKKLAAEKKLRKEMSGIEMPDIKSKGLSEIPLNFEAYSEKAVEAAGKIAKGLEHVQLKTTKNLTEFTTMLNDFLVSEIESSIVNIADMFGTMLTDDSFTGKDFGRGMLEMVADFLQKFGGLLIAWGLNFKLFKESVKSGQAVPAIIAGAAMIAAGAAIKGALKGGIGASVSVQPTYSGSNGGTNYAANDYSSEVMIRGREMIIVQSRERSFRR